MKWGYNDTHEAEETAETMNWMVVENAIIIAESAKILWRYYITDEEIRLVALIAELEDVNAMPEIAETILNRVLSSKFPDSVDEVIFQPKQFQTVGLITDDMTPSEGAVQAVTAVFRDGVSTIPDSLFFAEKTVNPQKIAKGLYLISCASETNFWGQE